MHGVRCRWPAYQRRDSGPSSLNWKTVIPHCTLPSRQTSTFAWLAEGTPRVMTPAGKQRRGERQDELTRAVEKHLHRIFDQMTNLLQIERGRVALVNTYFCFSRH